MEPEPLRRVRADEILERAGDARGDVERGFAIAGLGRVDHVDYVEHVLAAYVAERKGDGDRGSASRREQHRREIVARRRAEEREHADPRRALRRLIDQRHDDVAAPERLARPAIRAARGVTLLEARRRCQ
jgi:hypothetical protein